MNSLPPTPPPARKVFLSLSTVVWFCFLCLIGAVAFAWWGFNSRFADTARLERERAALSNQLHRAEIERQRGAEDARIVFARTRQTEALAKVYSATNALSRLLAEATTLAADAAGLRTNETGQLAALHPDLLTLARRFYESDLRALPASTDVIQKIEAARRLEQQLASAQGTAYEPDAALLASAESLTGWADEELKKTALLRTLLSTITQESKIKFTTAKVTATSPTLDDAMQQSVKSEATARQNVIVQQTSDAKTNAALAVAQAEASRIVENAKLEAAKIQQEIEAAKAELERQRTLKQAEENLKNTQTAVAAERKGDEANRLALRQRAAEPQIQAKLAPFITPGYMDAYGRTMVDKKPHSFSVLKSGGALEPTMDGLQKIADLGYSRLDKVRPRWTFKKYNSRGWRYNPEEMEMVKEVQKLLLDLGPVLVEMGHLMP